jgi:hypothetical protein
MPTLNTVFIALLHGRNEPDEQLNDWGFAGPVIGPVVLHWTYGRLNVHSPELNDFAELPESDGLVRYDGKFYGDFDILTRGDEQVAKARRKGGPGLHGYPVFARNVARDAAPAVAK